MESWNLMDFVCHRYFFLSLTGASSLFVASTSLAFALKVSWRAAQLRIQPSLIAGLFFQHEMGGLPPPMAEVIILNSARPGNVLGAIWARNFRNPSWSCVPQFVSDLFLAEMVTLGPENLNLSAKSSKSVSFCTSLEPAAFWGTDSVAGTTGVRGTFPGQGSQVFA